MRSLKMINYTWCQVSEHFCSFNNLRVKRCILLHLKSSTKQIWTDTRWYAAWPAACLEPTSEYT